jgi:Methyltransferase domain
VTVRPPVPPSGWQALQDAHPWPDTPPLPSVPVTGRALNGFAIIEQARAQIDKEHVVVLEIGAELGTSARRFLSEPNTFVASVDPWPDKKTFKGFDNLKSFAHQPDATLKLFQSFNFEFRDRSVAIRETSPRGPVLVASAGVDVDLVFIDGDHRYEAVFADLVICSALWPNAVLCGDDWSYDPKGSKHEGIRRPVQGAVRRWAQFNDFAVRHEANTWLIDQSATYNLEPLRPVGSASVEDRPADTGESNPLSRITDGLRKRFS